MQSSLPNSNNSQAMRDLVYKSLLELATDEGINASGKDEIYGCIFGRDSALTILKILRAHTKKADPQLLEICRRALLTLASLQGKEFNNESGEEPGKFIHEFRKERSQYEHLLKLERPFYVYPDGIMRIYDSVDATPLSLIALYKYWQLTLDSKFLVNVLPAVEAGLNWIITFGDKDKDLFVEYEFPEDRLHGGLVVQSWTDSSESMIQSDGKFPKYPIAPIEAQAYAWLALKLWADFYDTQSPEFARKLAAHAKQLKKRFNEKFVIEDEGLFFGAQALDGNKNLIKTITGNPLIALWATYTRGMSTECILEDKYISNFVERAFKDDLFDKDGGIRTMSTKSLTYISGQDCYHNGSFWPILNGLIHEGLEVWGFRDEADRLKDASLKAINYFGTPIELYIKSYEGEFLEYKNPNGQVSCRVQAWSAAAALDLVTP
jgi:glycogen debranching enzyme